MKTEYLTELRLKATSHILLGFSLVRKAYGAIGSSSVVPVLFKVIVQLFMVVADKFTLEAENISVFVEEEVVVIVAEPAKSNLMERICVADVHSFEVAIQYFSNFSTTQTQVVVTEVVSTVIIAFQRIHTISAHIACRIFPIPGVLSCSILARDNLIGLLHRVTIRAF